MRLPQLGLATIVSFMTLWAGDPKSAPHTKNRIADGVTGVGTGLANDSLRYGTGVWEPDSLGNHRAVVRVDAPSAGVFVRVPWRRRDKAPSTVDVIVMNAVTGTRVRNVARINITREFGDLVFESPSAGEYYIYYLPYTGSFKSNYPKITYRVPVLSADSSWLARYGAGVSDAALRALPVATMVGFDAVNEFSRFTPMEYIASTVERDALIAQNASAAYLAFAEDRSRSIRMLDDIPAVWAERGAFAPFHGAAKRGEYYTFQIGVWAHRGDVSGLRYRASDFVRRGGRERLPSSAVTAFNLEGVDWSGHRFTKAVRVVAGAVQPLWFGVDLPSAIVPGTYDGRVVLSALGVPDREIAIAIDVSTESVVNRGDDVPAQLTRLRWLNSQMAADDSVVTPYTPMTVARTASGATIGVLGRSMSVGADGMPSQIRSYFAAGNTTIGPKARELLTAPVQFVVLDSNKAEMTWAGSATRILRQASGAVEWRASRVGISLSNSIEMQVDARMEFEGTTEYRVSMRASKRTPLADVRLEVPLRDDVARYMMGLGQKGGFRPPETHWTWDVAKKNQDAVWLGDVSAGVQLTLKDEHYVRPLNTNFYLSKPLIAPTSWANDGKGGCDIVQREDRVVLSCYGGPRVLAAGDSLRFDFRLMLTPFKTLDTQAQWKTRYFHAFVPVDSIVKRGANTVNVHHANRVNPWINYPFIETGAMRAYIDSSHARGLKTKIYYTVRELTNHAPELFALRSLGDEVLSRGPGGGYSWLQEHLGDDYIAAWHVPAIKDAAIVNSGVSRWHNFYVEGLNWLVQHEKIDGLYLDDVAFDRTTMKRVRKVLDRGNAGALLDLHSANQYNPRDGFASSANLYLEHFPFLNRLWFGEYFDYDSRPDYWLIEISGIPFGLMGEMLEKGGNPWRGMTMGMTARMPWSGDPAPLWKAWDDFGIQQSTMRGWWASGAPVSTGDPNVLATTWIKKGSALISIGSWRDDDVRVQLSIDWKTLGIDPSTASIRAPEIEKFQNAGTWSPSDSITVPGKKGLLLVISPLPSSRRSEVR